MNSAMYERNIQALHRRNPDLAGEAGVRFSTGAADSSVSASGRYSATSVARNGMIVPLFSDGAASHSLYNPEHEASRLVDTVKPGSFVFFAGIGGGYHIRDFLSRFPEASCIVSESGWGSFCSLIALVDISDILSDRRVTVIPDCTADTVGILLQESYLPALNGSFCLLPLRSWQERNAKSYALLEKTVQDSLSRISADFSVQAHFGRLWLRNCVINLDLASEMQGTIPRFDATKTAVIAAAGPGLEAAFAVMKKNRDRMVVFSTDTAWNALADAGIIPDIVVSIDAQAVSASHVMRPFFPCMTVILDVCGNPAIARRAHECGATVIFAAGGHPLARYASAFSPLPILDTSSGTVTIAALDAARSLGFEKIEIPGSDFAYTGGKPYTRGTYLAHAFGKSAARLAPAELMYTALMFRTPVTRLDVGNRITYTTATLEQYARSLAAYRSAHRWAASDFRIFPSGEFWKNYRSELEKLAVDGKKSDAVLCSLLPFAAWHSVNRTERKGQKDMKNAIILALDLIAGYTGKS